ncbi:hypothetical protein Bca52824_068139 [Brassica carinata]|uniref:Uncharacterized protein n=1 Tax=Brassica carinata TaxID=52824 RepID=A0A8X7TZU8_BRACI|nr:hypothetical protein Bca52824_068139 [Brassica carinata]
MESVDTLSSTPTGMETPDAIELRKEQRKEPDRPLYIKYLKKRERVLLLEQYCWEPHTDTLLKLRLIVCNCVNMHRGQKTDSVDISLQPEGLDAMENVLPAKYEEAREEEIKQ